MKPIVYIDTETERFRPGRKVPPLICFQWLAEGDAAPSILDWRQARRVVGKLLTRAAEGEILLVAHNAAYDFAVIWNEWPELGPLVWQAYAADGISCTWVREKLIDIRRDKHSTEKGRYALDGIVKRRFRHTMTKDESIRTTFDRLRHVPLEEWPQDHVEYALDDVVWGMAVCREQNREMILKSIPTEFLEARAYFALGLTSAWGMRTNPERLKKIDRLLNEECDQIKKFLFEQNILRFRRKRDMKAFDEGVPLNELELVKTMANVQKLVEDNWDEEAQGEPVPRSAKTKKIATAAEHLEKLDHPVIEKYLRYQSLNTTITRYLVALWKGTREPIHTFFNLVDTTRSSSGGPNLQNFPRLPGMRECLEARPGTVYINVDFSAQEMRTLADTCVRLLGRSRLAERFFDPTFDPHVEYAAVKTGLPLDECYALHASKDPEFKKHRGRAKIPNFGIPGGMGKGGIVRFAWSSYQQRLTLTEAKDLIDTYFQFLPEMTDFFAFVRSCVGYDANYGDIKVPQLGFVRGGCRFTSGANCLFQAPAAHCSKAALFDVARACYDNEWSPLYGARPVNFIHDEIMLECDESYAPEAAEECQKIMVDAMQGICDHVPAQTEATLSRFWSKEAEPVYQNGRLQVWENDLFHRGEL